MMNNFHNPVLLQECIDGLNVNKNGIYVDATFGGGGHTLAILKKIQSGKVIAFDRDRDAISNNKIVDKNLMILNQNFKYLKNGLASLGIQQIDGLIADLGLSSYQLDTDNRGFSFNSSSNLDMRMNQESSFTAKDILNNYKEEQLSNLFRLYADFKNPSKISSAIINFRKTQQFENISDFKKLLSTVFKGPKQNKFLARVFQAIRMEVNSEIDCLKELLINSLKLIKPKGRLVIISYHSIEDRIVKNFFKFGTFNSFPKVGIYQNEPSPFLIITKKPIKATVKEINKNNRARSAKLRIAEIKE